MGGKLVQNYRGLEVWRGPWGLTMLCMFWYSKVKKKCHFSESVVF